MLLKARERSYAELTSFQVASRLFLVYKAHEVEGLENVSVDLPRNLEAHDPLGTMSEFRSAVQNYQEAKAKARMWESPDADIEARLTKAYGALHLFFQQILGTEFLPHFRYTADVYADFEHIIDCQDGQGVPVASSFFDIFVEHVFRLNRKDTLGGRKVALFPKGQFAIVPGRALPGDIIHRLYFEDQLRYILVRESFDSTYSQGNIDV
jgi:hypothetical protein